MNESAPVSPWLDDPPSVGAVLVTHNGATWLPKVLASFAHMTHAPGSWRAVDVESTDGSADLVRNSFGPERVIRAPRGAAFGEAVQLGIDALPRTDWIWLLHDDAAVVPETLSGLLDVATSDDDIAVVGPKIREWPSLRRLLEVGLTITGTGTRETGLETGEPDAGQHDRPRDVLAVNSAGMLVRRDVWDELGGFDADLPQHFDDIDFGWRAARAGYRTVTAPGGVLFHAEASKRGIRRAGGRPQWEQRRAGIFTQLANTGPLLFPWQYLRLLLGSVLRVAGLLIAKDPESAGDELLAVRSAYAHPVRLWRARRRRAATSRVSNRRLSDLFASRWLPYQHGFDALREAITAAVRPETIETVGRRSTLEQTPVEVEDLDDGPPLWQRRPWLVVVLVLTVVSLIASRSLLTFGGLSGGALPPAPDTAGGWWSLLLGDEGAPGLSGDAAPPLFALPLAALATPVWWRPELIVSLLMIFAIPLAALAAHRLGRLLSAQRTERMIWAVSYGAAVAAVGAVPQGRIGTVVALVVAPVIVNVACQLAQLNQEGRPAWQTALRLGIWVAFGAAFAPVVLVICLLGLLLMWFLVGRSISRQVLISATTAVILLGPWLIARAGVPTRWWWEAGRPLGGDQSILDVVAGRAGGLQAPWWLSVPILFLGVLALASRRSRGPVAVAWAIALIGLALALLGTTWRAEWVAVPSVLWLAGLATAALLAAPPRRQSARPVAILALAASMVLPLGVGGWWLLRGVDGPVDDRRDLATPAFLAERPGLTLVLTGSTAAGVRFTTVSGGGRYLGEEALEPTSTESEELTAVVQKLVARPTADDIAALSEAGIDAIYAPDVDPDLAQRIDGTPSVEQSGSDDPDSRTWTLPGTPQVERSEVPWWRRAVSGLQVVLWALALIMITPVRRRRETDESAETGGSHRKAVGV